MSQKHESNHHMVEAFFSCYFRFFFFPLSSRQTSHKQNSPAIQIHHSLIWDGTPLILNSVRSVRCHLETTVGFIPEVFAADKAWGSDTQTFILLFHKPVKSVVSCSFPFSPKRLWPLEFKIQFTVVFIMWKLPLVQDVSWPFSVFNLPSTDCQPGSEEHIWAVWAILVQRVIFELQVLVGTEHFLQLQIPLQKSELWNNGYTLGWHAIQNNECLNVNH